MIRVHLSGQRLLLAVGLLGLGTLAVIWAQRGSLTRAAAQPPGPASAQAPAPVPEFPPASSSEYSQRVVAYIYDTVPITREELGEYLIARVGPDRLPNLVNKRIIEHFCQQKGIEVTPAEVEADFAETLKGLNNLRAVDFVKNILKPYNKTLYEWKEDVIKPRLLLTKLCRDRVQVTDEDIRFAYEAQYGEKVACRMILWPRSESRRVDAIYAKIRDNEAEFERVAKQQATPNLASKGGQIEPIGHHTVGNEALEKAAFALQPGEISRKLEVPEGLVVLRCDKRLPPNTAVKIETVHDKLAKEVFDRKLQMEIPKMFNELKEKAQPKVFLPHEETEDELKREARKELQADSGKAGPIGGTPAPSN